MRPKNDVFGASIKKAYELEGAKAKSLSKEQPAVHERAEEEPGGDGRPAPRAFVKFRIP